METPGGKESGILKLRNHVVHKLLGLLLRIGTLVFPKNRLNFAVHQIKRLLVRRHGNARAGFLEIRLTEGARNLHLLRDEVRVTVHLEIIREAGILDAHGDAVADCNDNRTAGSIVLGCRAGWQRATAQKQSEYYNKNSWKRVTVHSVFIMPHMSHTKQRRRPQISEV